MGPAKRASVRVRGGSGSAPLGHNHHCCSNLAEPPYKRSAVSAGCQNGAAFPTGAAGHHLARPLSLAKLRTAIRLAMRQGLPIRTESPVSVTRTESRSLDRTSASAGASINVGAVVDRDDLDYVPFLIDPINDAVLTAPGSP